jgi:tetratricopeptide (TPR) repeat protein
MNMSSETATECHVDPEVAIDTVDSVPASGETTPSEGASVNANNREQAQDDTTVVRDEVASAAAPAAHAANPGHGPNDEGNGDAARAQPSPLEKSGRPRNDSIANAFGYDEHQSAETSSPPSSSTLQAAPQGDVLEDFVATLRVGSNGVNSAPQLSRARSADNSGHSSGTDSPVVSNRTMLPTTVRRPRKSFKLTDAPLARAHTMDGSAAGTASPTRGITCPPMQIRPSAVSDTVAKVLTRPANVRRELPDPLPVPMSQRCDFCVKFDSVCSNCHFKWKKTVKAQFEKVMAYIGSQPEASRILVMFASVARGHVEFVEAALDAYPDAVHWSAHFLRSGAADSSINPAIEDAGRVCPLHVAMAANRLDIAVLLIKRNAPFRRSDKNVLPLDLLPDPLPSAWEQALGALDAYRVHMLCERSKTLRKEAKYDEAEKLYQEALEIQPTSEHALCGLAKMSFDAADYKECVARCDKILAMKEGEIAWGQFGPPTVELLHKHATEKLHETAHPTRGGILRKCGCIVWDYYSLHLRRIPFKIIRRNVIPFLDCIDAVHFHLATKRMPLLCRFLAGHAASLHPDYVLRWITSEKENAERLVDELRRSKPVADNVKTEDPVTYKGYRVFAVADFNTILITSYAETGNPKARKEKTVWFGKKKESEPKTLWFSKQFQISRGRLGEPWTVAAAGEWELAPSPLASPSPQRTTSPAKR